MLDSPRAANRAGNSVAKRHALGRNQIDSQLAEAAEAQPVAAIIWALTLGPPALRVWGHLVPFCEIDILENAFLLLVGL